jgi:hypothetical protein
MECIGSRKIPDLKRKTLTAEGFCGFKGKYPLSAEERWWKRVARYLK